MRRTLVVICILLSAYAVQAQRLLAQPKHYVGVKGGATVSFVNFVPTVSQGMKYAFVSGAVYRMVNEQYFGIQLEANYAQRGWVEDTGYNRTLAYIEIPFLSHITFGNKTFKWFFNVGPSVSFLIHEENLLTQGESSQQITPVYNIVDYSIMGGTGFELHTKAGVWNLEARYSFGLGDIFSNRAGEHFKGSSNQNIYVTLAWLIGVSNKEHM